MKITKLNLKYGSCTNCDKGTMLSDDMELIYPYTYTYEIEVRGFKMRMCETCKQELFKMLLEDKDNIDKTIEELDLTVRAYNCLKRANINTVTELCKFSEMDLWRHCRNIDRRSIELIVIKLDELGLKLKEEE
jgi:DNA-directed RNA polymerase alpha subunit